jgi:hypothetical protein
LLRRLEINPRPGQRRPTLHSFRHYAESRTMPSMNLINCQSAIL